MKIYRILIIILSIPAILFFAHVHIFPVSKAFRIHPIAKNTGNIALSYSYDEIINEFPNRTVNPKKIEQPSLDQSDIIIMGDSYSDFYDGGSIYGFLTKAGHVVRNHYTLNLKETNKKKIVFLIFGKLTLSSDIMRNRFAQFNNNIKHPNHIKKIFNILFPDELEYKYNYFLNRSYYTFGTANKLRTFRHKLYEERSRRAIYADQYPRTILYSRVSILGYERDSLTVAKDLNINSKILLETEKSLKEKGYQLYIVIAPVKPEIIPIHSDHKSRNYHEVIAQKLSGAGLQVIDATPILTNIGPSSYTCTDSHWSSIGMKAVADSLSKVANSYQKE